MEIKASDWHRKLPTVPLMLKRLNILKPVEYSVMIHSPAKIVNSISEVAMLTMRQLALHGPQCPCLVKGHGNHYITNKTRHGQKVCSYCAIVETLGIIGSVRVVYFLVDIKMVKIM